MLRKTAIVTGLFLLLILLAEAGMRLKGFKPYETFNADIKMQPGWMYDNDSLVGLSLHPGIYRIEEMGTYKYTAIINSNRERITSLNDSASPAKPVILVLGAGSTFGQGMNDDESFPYVLQSLLPDYKVRNRAVMGYGLSNNYRKLMLSTDLKKGDAVIYIYHEDQNNRNNRTNRKRALPVFDHNAHFDNYHYVNIDSNLQTKAQKYSYHLFPLSNYSAFSNYLEDSYNTWQDKKERANHIARKAILNMNEWCKKRGVEFKLVCWKDDPVNMENIAWFAKHGVHAYNIKVIIAFGDRPQKELAKANRTFADSLSLLFKRKD